MEKPLDGGASSEKVGERVIDKPELPQQGIATDSTVYTEVIVNEAMLKRGKAGNFEVFCDEGAHIGGSGRYPTPMAYMALGVGW